MKLLELFSGSGIMSQTFKEQGHQATTLDLHTKADIKADILGFSPKGLAKLLNGYDVIWMSPPCQTFSMAAGNTHWTADRKPKTKKAIEAQRIIRRCSEIAHACNLTGKLYFIENPRARARWFLPEHNRHTITFCQYGENRMKPTDIWTNCKTWKSRPMCKNGDPCHVRAPRGSKTGTQGLKGAYERGKLPKQLCEEIVQATHWETLLPKRKEYNLTFFVSSRF